MTPSQQAGHTHPSSGRSRTAWHAAHCGASSTVTSASSVRGGAEVASGALFGEVVADGVAPEPLEAVEGSALTAEHVHDEVEVVEQDPLGALHTFGHGRPLVELLLERVAHRVGNRRDLARVGAGTDHEVVGEAV